MRLLSDCFGYLYLPVQGYRSLTSPFNATVVGIPLLAESKQGLQPLATVVAGLASLLPERARAKQVEIDDDF